MKKKVVILNYGLGNYGSLIGVFTKLNCITSVSDTKNEIENSDLIVLPGVGTFPEAMKNLKKKKLDKFIKKISNKGKKILGICLGMQLLTNSSNEIVYTEGLKIIDGRFDYLNNHNIGWSKLNVKKKSTFFRTFEKDFFFFQHNLSYVGSKKNIIAYANGSKNLISIIQKKNITGVQFHPEKSQKAGIKFLKSVLEKDFSND